VLEAFRTKDRSELDLHLEFLRATEQDDPETPYKNIIAIGESAAVLHHVDYKKRATSRDPESLLVDAGAAYQGYCSDVTRTWLKGDLAASATLSAFGAIVSGVEAMQQRLCDAVKVGNGYEKLHEESHRQVADILREVGIVSSSAEETVASGITRAFYPHGLGHSLGLQCHDVGCALIKPKPENPYLRNTSMITPDQCFTIEPGIYFIEGLLGPLRETAAARTIDFRLVAELSVLGGVRIEDDLVVLDESSPSAIRNLTREHLPIGGGAA
jgi:Xaa-Pro dipeptidase